MKWKAIGVRLNEREQTSMERGGSDSHCCVACEGIEDTGRMTHAHDEDLHDPVPKLEQGFEVLFDGSTELVRGDLLRPDVGSFQESDLVLGEIPSDEECLQ